MKNAFQHGDLEEEVYMEQLNSLAGLGSQVFFADCTSFCLALNCLHEHGLEGWALLYNNLVWLVMKHIALCSTNTHPLFTVCISWAVDDIIITSNDYDGIKGLKLHFFQHFQTKDLGRLWYFLRIEVAQ